MQKTIEATPLLLLRHDLCAAAADPQYTRGAPPVYIPIQDYEQAIKKLSDPSMAVALKPEDVPALYSIEAQQGLLYLPYSYLVPGGRFNSMYGWDTAFPVFAWAGEHPQVMREQVDNQLYQISRYGKVLNANRTYHLSRSQPPLIAAMVLSVYKAAQGRAWADFDRDGLFTNAQAWLAAALPMLEQFYTYWTTGERLAGETKLSRYWDEADVPAPEVIMGEPGHFEQAHERFVRRSNDATEESIFFNDKADSLSPLYYRADRAMRASGFDPNAHWGYGALRCLFHAPVCLNSLLYQMEHDIAEICQLLGQPHDLWNARRAARKAAMQQYLYNTDSGLYEDYDFVRGQRNASIYATAFYPLWAGLYTEAEASRAAKAILEQLETPYGIVTSLELSGCQWDFPFGWPPLQYFAMAGLSRCGLADDAKRLAQKYLTLAGHVFAEHGALFEKYNMRDGNADIKVSLGYHDNASENGTFLWTAACLKLAQDCLAGKKL